MKYSTQFLVLVVITTFLYACASTTPCMERKVGAQVNLRGDAFECFYEITKNLQDGEHKKLGYLCIIEDEPKLVLELENAKDEESLSKAWKGVVAKESLIVPTGGVDKSGRVWHGGQIVEKTDKDYFSVAVSTLEEILVSSNALIDIDPIFVINKNCENN